MKIIKTANYKKLKADYDPYDESEEWSPEKEERNDIKNHPIFDEVRKMLPDLRQKSDEQKMPRPGESLELYMQRRNYIIQSRLNKLLELNAPQPIIDNEYKLLERVKEEGPDIYHNFKMDEAQRKNI
jgi:hypothetical protein